MSTHIASSDDIDPAIPLGVGETIEWLGRPRTTVILPSVAVGLLLVALGIFGSVQLDPLVAIGLVPLGLVIPAGHYLVVANIQYAVSDRAIYAKRGVLGRSVTQANLETVQNSSYSQGITGSIFGYGTVAFEIAGGNNLSFHDIREPKPVRSLVDRATREQDGLTGERHRGSSTPGSAGQWQDVRMEVRAIRHAVEGRGWR